MHSTDLRSSSVPTAETSLTIAGISHSVILQYFTSLNAGEFDETSALFAIDGAMQPPFEQPIVGPAAIADYLTLEAKGMTLHPQEGVFWLADNGCTEVQISGKVQTSWFTVNVSWFFALSPDQEIFFVRVKLLASPQELLKLRRTTNS